MTLPLDIANALIVAQNALVGYVQLSNGSDTEEHHATAQHAFDAVREAIRAHGLLKADEGQPASLFEPRTAEQTADLLGALLKTRELLNQAASAGAVGRLAELLYPDEIRSACEGIAAASAALDLQATAEHPQGLPENPISPGDLVRMTDAYRRAINATGGFLKGEVLDVRDDCAEVDWLDENLPRQVELAVLEKVERAKQPEPTAQRAGGFALGDTVRFRPEFLQSTGQVASETARLRGTILALKPIGTIAKATVEWSNGKTHAVLTSNLARAEVRGRG